MQCSHRPRCDIEDVQPVRVVVVVEAKLVADGGGVPPEVDIERVLASGDATPADPGHMVLSVGGPADLPREVSRPLERVSADPPRMVS